MSRLIKISASRRLIATASLLVIIIAILAAPSFASATNSHALASLARMMVKNQNPKLPLPK